MPTPSYQRTPTEYAWLYQVSLATIQRWQRRSLPLDDPRALAKDLASGRGTGIDAAMVPRWRDVPEQEW